MTTSTLPSQRAVDVLAHIRAAAEAEHTSAVAAQAAFAKAKAEQDQREVKAHIELVIAALWKGWAKTPFGIPFEAVLWSMQDDGLEQPATDIQVVHAFAEFDADGAAVTLQVSVRGYPHVVATSVCDEYGEPVATARALLDIIAGMG